MRAFPTVFRGMLVNAMSNQALVLVPIQLTHTPIPKCLTKHTQEDAEAEAAAALAVAQDEAESARMEAILVAAQEEVLSARSYTMQWHSLAQSHVHSLCTTFLERVTRSKISAQADAWTRSRLASAALTQLKPPDWCRC